MIEGVGVLLVSSIGGYWVLERAVTHKGPLRRVGQWLGAIIIVTSVVGVACKIWYATARCASMAKQRRMCPYPKSFAPGSSSTAPSTPMDEGSEDR